jgi:hypothetical protein
VFAPGTAFDCTSAALPFFLFRENQVFVVVVIIIIIIIIVITTVSSS